MTKIVCIKYDCLPYLYTRIQYQTISSISSSNMALIRWLAYHYPLLFAKHQRSIRGLRALVATRPIVRPDCSHILQHRLRCNTKQEICTQNSSKSRSLLYRLLPEGSRSNAVRVTRVAPGPVHQQLHRSKNRFFRTRTTFFRKTQDFFANSQRCRKGLFRPDTTRPALGALPWPSMRVLRRTTRRNVLPLRD